MSHERVRVMAFYLSEYDAILTHGPTRMPQLKKYPLPRGNNPGGSDHIAVLVRLQAQKGMVAPPVWEVVLTTPDGRTVRNDLSFPPTQTSPTQWECVMQISKDHLTVQGTHVVTLTVDGQTTDECRSFEVVPQQAPGATR